MFVWIFHRVSGLLLIVLIALQVLTGTLQAEASSSQAVQSIAALHKSASLNCLMVFLFTFHSMYGIRTILMDLGLAREKLLFWVLSSLGVVLYAAFLVHYFSLGAG